MAGDWIKMRTNLDCDAHVVGMACFLELPELHVIGLLWKAWAWADQHTLDGNAMRVTEKTLDRFTGVTGFAAALRKVGWLEGQDGALTFPRFSEHNGQTAKNRLATAQRAARFRVASSIPEVTHPPLPREEKRIVEKKKEEREKTSHLALSHLRDGQLLPRKWCDDETIAKLEEYCGFCQRHDALGRPLDVIALRERLAPCGHWQPDRLRRSLGLSMGMNRIDKILDADSLPPKRKGDKLVYQEPPKIATPIDEL